MHNFDLADDLTLFKHLVQTLIRKGCENNYYTYSQFANLTFGIGNSLNIALVSRVIRSYQTYFERKGAYKCRLLVEKVKVDHPEIFGTRSSTPHTFKGNATTIIDEQIRALREEIVAIKQTTRPIKIDRLIKLKRISDKYVYSANVHWFSDEELILNEGALIKLLPAGISGAVLSYDAMHGSLFFECGSQLNTEMYYKMEVDTVSIINPLIDILATYSRDGIKGLTKIITSRESYPNSLQITPTTFKNLDPSQEQAAQKALTSDVTFIWGPPGTGKSHCLSEILKKLFEKRERTLVVSVANVAVDQLLAKTLNSFDHDYPLSSSQLIHYGEVLRVGYITEEPLERRFDDAPEQKHILSMYRKIKDIRQKEQNAKTNNIKAELVAERRALSREVDEIQKKRIEKGKLLFTTATKALIDPKISVTDFDNLVVDEASMMSIPYFYGLLKRIAKRVIIAGDFAQLSPICKSQTQLADKYLKQDLFSLAGIKKNNVNHPSLSTLVVNRRATQEICNLYNNAFYNGRMTVQKRQPSKETAGIYYFPLPSEGAELTDSNSRRNTCSFRVVTKFALERLVTTTSTIGIVTPYRAQANDYKKFFKEQKLPKEVIGRLKVGTIHTFQGSEAETLIFDTVDTRELGIGRLFHHEQGERLVNVAVSRAKDALIVFGDLEAFYNSNQVSGKILNVFNAIKPKRLNL